MPEQEVQETAAEGAFKNNRTTADMIIPSSASPPIIRSEVAAEVSQLLQSIKTLHGSPNHISFWMGVNKDDGKASLVAIPTSDNFEKLKEYYDQLPKKIRNTIQKNMAKEDFASFESIMRSLTAAETKALEATAKGDGSVNSDENSTQVRISPENTGDAGLMRNVEIVRNGEEGENGR